MRDTPARPALPRPAWQDEGFAPAVAFQTVAADGTSGLLCAQLQALVQTALQPLARCGANVDRNVVILGDT